MTLEEATRLLFDWMAQRPDKVKAQKAALDRYGKYFAPSNIPNVTQEGFKEFLLIKNNRHWAGIHRQPGIYADMGRLRQCLTILLDESTPIEKRLETIIPRNALPFIRGLGRALLTPILMCVYPDRYAVYNRISDEGLTRLGRNPITSTDSFARRYVALNQACHEIGKEITQPLYLVDSMFSLMVHGVASPLVGPLPTGAARLSEVEPGEPAEQPAEEEIEERLRFPLEKYLQEFIVANWEKTALGKALALHVEDEEAAVEYPTPVGRIDILARDRATGDWVVIELKRGMDSDRAVGQLLRYMGWVKKHKATMDEKVRGVIITNEPDDRIRYAVSMSDKISFCTYRVSFDLTEEAPI